MNSVFARRIQETLNPTVRRTFNALWRAGYFGNGDRGVGARLHRMWQRVTQKTLPVVPEIVVQAAAAGLDVYEIEYISPAARFMQAEKLQGIFSMSDAVSALSQVFPQITDNVDPDELSRDIYKYTGAPTSSQRTVEAVAEWRSAKAKEQAAAQQLEGAKQGSEIARNVAQARATIAPPRGPMP